jgi:membrane protein YqaA with SNARE-associated domain
MMPEPKYRHLVPCRLRVRIRWVRLTLIFLGLIALSFGLAYLMQRLIDQFSLPLFDFAWLAYLIVFATALVSNLTIIAPVAFGISIMIAAATTWNPALIALAGAAGGTLGELSGYYAGRFGRKVALPPDILPGMGIKRVESWINRYGLWAIMFLAFQPIIPFDIGGLVAGATRMHLLKFLPALFVGKFAKFLIICFAGAGLVQFLPAWMY